MLPSCQHLPIYGIIISVSALTLKAEPGRWNEAKPALPPRLPGLLGVAPFSSLRASPAPCPRHFVRNTVLLPQTPFPSIPSSNPSTALRIQALESDCLRLSPGFPHINYMALIKCDLTLKTDFLMCKMRIVSVPPVEASPAADPTSRSFLLLQLRNF